MNRSCVCNISWLSAIFFAFLLLGCAPSAEVFNEKMMVDEPDSSEAILIQDVERGRDLFMGNVHFESGGPPCMGCHNVGDNGLLGGGALGPDLTNVTTERNQSELSATLSSSTRTLSPVMQPIYAEHPLTAEERADLIAFMTASARQPESNHELLLYGMSIGGFVAVVGLIQLRYRKRLRGVRKPMVEKANSQKR